MIDDMQKCKNMRKSHLQVVFEPGHSDLDEILRYDPKARVIGGRLVANYTFAKILDRDLAPKYQKLFAMWASQMRTRHAASEPMKALADKNEGSTRGRSEVT